MGTNTPGTEQGRRPLDELLPRLCEALRRTPAQAAYLFGSWSQGQADAFSDIDLLVVCDTGRPFFERWRDFEPLYELPGAIDLLIYRPEELEAMREAENPLIQEILTKGLKLL